MMQRFRISLIILVAGFFLIPFWLLFAGALQPLVLPDSPVRQLMPEFSNWRNFLAVGDIVNIWRYMANSLIIAIIGTPLSLAVGSMAGFAIAQLGWQQARIYLTITFVALMIPATALLVGKFLIFKSIGFNDSFLPLLAPILLGGLPLSVLLYYWAFRRLPKDYVQSLLVEGATYFQTWLRLLPALRPVNGMAGLLIFMSFWSNFFDPLVFVSSERLFTLPLGLKTLSELDPADQPLLLAGAIIYIMPVLIAAILAMLYAYGVRARRTSPSAALRLFAVSRR